MAPCANEPAIYPDELTSRLKRLGFDVECNPIRIDGKLDEASWQRAQPTGLFGWIDRDDAAPGCWERRRVERPEPDPTEAFILWDDGYLYVGFRTEDSDIWANFTEQEMPLWDESDFEVFIDPDGDTDYYYEAGINPLNTTYDLLLVKPWRLPGGGGLVDWVFDGMKTAVCIDGTLNVRNDEDKGWSGEFAFPWSTLSVYSGDMPCPPRDGDTWRMNFSRVRMHEASGCTADWTWSPQGAYNMHIPERFGYVRFSTREVGR